MKLKNITALILLVALSFSIVHEYSVVFYDKDHHNVAEYVLELSGPSSHGDICDIHFEYHQSFLLSQNTKIPDIEYISVVNTTDKESYSFKTNLDFFKPPIA